MGALIDDSLNFRRSLLGCHLRHRARCIGCADCPNATHARCDLRVDFVTPAKGWVRVGQAPARRFSRTRSRWLSEPPISNFDIPRTASDAAIDKTQHLSQLPRQLDQYRQKWVVLQSRTLRYATAISRTATSSSVINNSHRRRSSSVPMPPS